MNSTQKQFSLNRGASRKQIPISQTILITGARAPIALELARSFASNGHRVVMADSLHLTIARWSNSVEKYVHLPSPRYDIGAYIKALQQIIDAEKVAHLIPTCEEAIFIAMQKHRFKCKVWTCNGDLIGKLHNKYAFSQSFQDDFPIPKTVLLKDFSDWAHSEEYVFKRVYSRFATATIIGKSLSKSFFADDEAEDWVVQQFIKGYEVCVYSIWDEGILKAYTLYHPLYRAGKGAGIFFEPVSNAEVWKYVSDFGQKQQFSGQLCFDVIVDASGVPYFIECNPRGTSGAHFINDHLADCFLGKKAVVADNVHEYALKYTLAIFHPILSFSKRIRDSKDVVFRRNDRKPFFLQFLSLLEIAYIKVVHRKSWFQATTDDIEWNGS